MNREQKQEFVSSLHETLRCAEMVVVTHCLGLDASETHTLRCQMREQGVGFKVAKNTLTLLALKDTPYEGLVDLFKGMTAIAYSSDPMVAAKASVNFSKKNDKLVLLGGGLGEKRLNVQELKELAALPSLDTLRSRLVGLLKTPATNLARVLQAPAGQVAGVLGAYAKKD